MSEKKVMVPAGRIEQRILLIRGEKVIVDADLAEFYGVPTKRLNEQIMELVKAIKQLLKPDPLPKKRRIGFHSDKH
jgi:hypothetical protein